MSPLFHSARRGCAGFTLAELSVVIGILAILSVAVFSRLDGTFAATRGTYDQLLAQVSYARKLAIAQRRAVFVRIEAGESRLCYSAAGACTGGDGVASPTGAVPFRVDYADGVTATQASFQFDALGRYLDAAGAPPAVSLVVLVTGEGSQAFTVEVDTGYVHP